MNFERLAERIKFPVATGLDAENSNVHYKISTFVLLLSKDFSMLLHTGVIQVYTGIADDSPSV